MEISKTQLKSWLATIPNGREWLAQKCGVSKSTVDGWCSNRPIPGPAQVVLQDLMRAQSQPAEGRLVISLSPDEYVLVEAAAARGSYATLDTFAHAACMEKAQQLTARPAEIPAYLREDPPALPVKAKRQVS